ncbi:Oligoendopeptidase F, plasmid [compost metagenome]
MFAEFELEMHKRAWNEEPITHDKASDFYYELNKKYFGEAVVSDSEIRYEWLRIPHFYTPFYVYQYATGISAACYIVEGILNQKEGALESYLAFLKTGGRDYPVELLKIAGVDMNDPKVVESAITLFENTMKQFQELYKK